MKKMFVFVAAAGFLAACNNTQNSKSEVRDSVLETIDSTKNAKIDSIKDTASKQKEEVKATFEKTDSANRAIADSAKAQSKK